MLKKTLILLGFTIITAILLRCFLVNRPQGKHYSPSLIINTDSRKQQEEFLEKTVQRTNTFNPVTKNNTITETIVSLDSDKEIKTLIKNLENDNFQISQEAADKLTAIGKEAVPLLCETMKNSDTPLKGQIAFILGRIGDTEASSALLCTIKDKNAYIRRNSAEALGKIKDEQAVFALSLTLFDKDISVRQRSAWALGELSHPHGASSLLDRIRDEKEMRVKTAIVNALGNLKDNQAVETLLSELKTYGDQLYKNAVINALAEIKDMSTLSAIIEYADKLKKDKPVDNMLKGQWEESIKIAESAIEKIKKQS